MNFSTSAIIVAAGRGKRMGSVDKSFIKSRGIPIIKYSFDCLYRYKYVKEIIIVMNEKNMVKGKELFRSSSNVKIVPGGDTRAESAKQGVLRAKEEFVLIHDAVRPFITRELLDEMFSAMQEGVDAVIPGTPVKSTIKKINNDSFVEETLERKKLIEVQTPELFRRNALLNAYEKCTLGGITDEAMLIENMQGKVKVVKGLEENIKITTPFDLILMEGIIKKWSKK